MKVILSFDDGRSDAYDAYQILLKHNLVGSFHITTGFVDGSFKTDSFGIGRKPITIEQLREMKNNGMDISSHGDRHILDNDDFRISILKLKQWKILGTNERCGFSVPNSDYEDGQLNKFCKDNNDVLDYVRVGRSKKCYRFLSKASYLLYKLLHLQFFYNYFNKFNLIKSIDKHHIVSCVIKKGTKINNVIKFIRKYSSEDCAIVLMFHSITSKASNPWEYRTEDFLELCLFLKTSKVDVITLKTLVA